MEFNHCVSLQEAFALVMNHVSEQAITAEKVPLANCLGRTAAVDITAKEALPAFSRSTVDGFAINSADTFGATEGIPALLALTGEVLMGQPNGLTVETGQAVAIPTGGKLPPGTDAVVMLEYTEVPDKHSVLIAKAAAPGENVIAKGEDFATGDIIVRRGHVISPQVIGALAACGYSHLPVSQRPHVAIISTGDELVDVGTEIVAEGQIRDINSYALAAMLEQLGCSVKRAGIVPDNYDTLRQVLNEALATSQLVIISGGSSVGTRDHTVRVLQSYVEDNSVLFHGITIKPGKPTIFGMVGKIPVFGLPGHPVSAMTICHVLIKPLVAALLGQPCLEPPRRIMAQITRNVASAPGRDDFVRVKLRRLDGNYWAEPIFGKSGLISTYLQADGIIHITAMKSGLYREDWVEVELLP